jgi:hypothetical protein
LNDTVGGTGFPAGVIFPNASYPKLRDHPPESVALVNRFTLSYPYVSENVAVPPFMYVAVCKFSLLLAVPQFSVAFTNCTPVVLFVSVYPFICNRVLYPFNLAKLLPYTYDNSLPNAVYPTFDA